MKKGERLPLIVFLHGFLSDKREYISDTKKAEDDYKTVQFNNVWFASRGYAVLNYSARGHGASGGEIGLASKHLEVHDTQHLTGLLVDDGTAKRRKVAAVGGSYGGGQTWLLATVAARARSSTAPGARRRAGSCGWRRPCRSSPGPTCSSRSFRTG